MKKSFILYTDICNGVLSMLGNTSAGTLFRMIVDYANGKDVQPCGELATDMAFQIIKSLMDTNMQAYNAVVEKRREAGRKGAEITNGKKRQKRQMPTKTANADKSGKIGKHGCNDMLCNEIKDTNVSYDNLITNSNELESSSQLDFNRLVDFFNSELKKRNSLIPSIKQLSDARKKTLKARVREYGKESLVKVFRKAAVSDFLNGKNDRSFTASFDWLLKPTNFPKVLEGNYDNPVKDKPKDAITSNVNGLIEQVRQEQAAREEEKRQRVIGIYEKAKQGDERSIGIIEDMRRNGTLAKYNLK